MQPDLLKLRVNASTSEQCTIVCAYFGDEISLEQGFIVRDTFDRLDTDGWWFFNPGTFIAAFRWSQSGAARSRACESALAQLRQDNSTLPNMSVGSADGPVLTTIAKEGHLETPPIGNVVNEAFHRALANAS